MKRKPDQHKRLTIIARKNKASLEISPMVQKLYKDALVATIYPAGFTLYKLKSLLTSLRPRYKMIWKKSMSYLNEGIKAMSQKISSLSGQVGESEMVQYWKDFICGLPEYSSLVKAKKFQEIEHIFITLAKQNEILGIQDTRIKEIKKAMQELRNEGNKS